jgi:catechol 2,3-dioxygenase
MSEQHGIRLGHVGLYVTDVPKMVDFYTRVLGFVVTDAADNMSLTFLSRNAQDHHQIVLVAGRAPGVQETVQQVSFNVGSIEAVQKVFSRIVDSEAYDLNPVTHGIAFSVYFRDPEGNRLEMFADSDWYTTQPCRIPIDLTRPAADLKREAEEYCRAQKGFKLLKDWQAEFARNMATAH